MPAKTGDTPGELVPGEADVPERQCVFCDRAWGVFGLLIGAMFLYIGIDMLTGSRLSTMLSGTREVTE